MKFIEYLNKYGDPISISERIFNDLGVLMKTHENLHLFKYSQIDAKWQFSETHEARGCILTYEKGSWKYVSRPFDKFFNLSEGKCVLFNKNIPEDAYLVEKSDGSLIQVYFYNNKWNISTSGSIISGNVNDNCITFADLFLKIADPKMFDLMNPERTYMFELCSSLNIVVTQYENDRIYFHGSRNNETGRLFYNEKLPGTRKGKKLSVPKDENIEVWMEKELSNPEYGKNPEGFVIYIKDLNGDFYPAAKIKSAKYLTLHRTVSGGDLALSRKRIKELFYKDQLDDIIGDIPSILIPYTEEIKKEYDNILSFYKKNVNELRNNTYSNQKEYALKVKDLKPGPMSSLFFQEKEAVLNSSVNDIEIFHNWIKENYEKYGK